MDELCLLTQNEKIAYQNLPVPFAIFHFNASRLDTVLFSDALPPLLHTGREELTDLLQTDLEAIIHPDDREKFHTDVSAACLHPDGAFKTLCRLQAGGTPFRYMSGVGKMKRLEDDSWLLYVQFHDEQDALDLQREENAAQKRRNSLVSHILANTRSAIFWKDADRRFLGANRAFLDYYGFADEHVLLGKNDEEMGWHTDPDPYKNDELRVLNEGISTCRVPGKCLVFGETRDIVASKAPLRVDGKIVGLVGSFEDVTTEEKQRREIARLNDELHQRIEDHKRLMAISDVCIVKIRLADYTLVEYNETMCQLIGYSREEYEQIFHGRMEAYFTGEYLEELEKVKAAVRKALSEKVPSFSIQLRMPTRTGFLPIGGAGSFEPFSPGTQAPQYLIAIFRDISSVLDTQAKLARAELEAERTALLAEQNEKLQSLINGIPSGLASLQIKNGVPDTMVQLNHYFFERVDIKESPDGRVPLDKIHECLHPDDQRRYREDLAKILGKRQPLSLQYRFRRVGTNDYYWGSVRNKIVHVSEELEMAYFIFTDIDAMKKAELSLRESQLIYENTINATKLAMWTYDIVNHRLIMGRNAATVAVCRRFGWPDVFEDAPESSLDFIDERDRESYLATFRSIDAGHNASCEIWYKPRENDFEPFCARETYTVILDEAGTPVRAYGIMQDITAEKKVRDRYEREMSYLHQNSDKALIAKGHCNLTRNLVLDYNVLDDRIGRIPTSIPYESALKKVASMAYTEQERELIQNGLGRQHLIESYHHGEMWTTLRYRRAVQGSLPLWISVHTHTYMVPGSNELACFMYGYDITEHMLNKDITQIISNRAFDYIGIIFSQNNLFMLIKKSDSITFLKERDKTDYDICRKYVETHFIHETELQEFRSAVALSNILGGLAKNDRHCAVYHRMENGRQLCKQLDYGWLDKRLGIILVARTDVTATYEREQKQRAAIEAAKLEADRANEAKTAFLSSMSHDLRTPLNGVLGFTEFALKEDSPEKKQDYLKKINASGRLLLELVNDTLDLSRIESGKITLDEGTVTSDELVPAVVMALRPSAELKNLHLLTDFPESSLPLCCDKLKIQKIALNLISNSIKYTPEGGTISVSFAVGAPDTLGCNFKLVVEDSGIGMSEEFMAHMYEPFAQEKRSETVQVPGTGLGLSIVKRYIDFMGGTISVSSRIHQGTRWLVYLPVKTVSGEQASGNEDLDASGRLDGKRILLCEDNYINTEIVSMLLKNEHMLVETAGNGKIGVDKFANSPMGYYDGIFMDVRMPIMDGLAATRAIRKMERSDAGRMPIIALTADTFEESVREIREAGMNDVLAKPIDSEKFYAALRKNLLRSKAPA